MPFLLAAFLPLGGQLAALPWLILPPDEGAWVVRVETSGGLSGRGTGSMTASSGGELFCVAMVSCPERLVADAERSLTTLISAVPPGTGAPAPAPPLHRTTCSDCVTTTLTITRRAAAGALNAVYTWDESTVGAVPEEIRKLHAAIRAITSTRDR